MRKMTISMIITLILLISAMAFAKGQGFHRENNFGNREQPKMETMNLTDSQMLQLNIIKADQRRRLIRLKADMDFIEIKKKQIVMNRKFNPETYKAEIKKTMEIINKVEMVNFDSIDKTRKILTDEQWKIFCKMSSKKKRRSSQENNFSRRPKRGGEYSRPAMEY